MFKALGRQIPPPAGVQPPSLWGVESHLNKLFGASAATWRSPAATCAALGLMWA